MSEQPTPAAPAADHGHMDHNALDITYLKIFGALTILTIVEILCAGLPFAKWALALALILMAFTKAALVAAFYMHLKFEGKLLYIVVAIPCLLVTILTMGLTPDVANRHLADKPKTEASPAPAKHE